LRKHRPHGAASVDLNVNKFYSIQLRGANSINHFVHQSSISNLVYLTIRIPLTVGLFRME